MNTQALQWCGDHLRILDQTRLPAQEVYLELQDYRAVAEAIKSLRVRGAPAIGVAAGYGIALGALSNSADSLADFKLAMCEVMSTIAATRPTAKNLFVSVKRMEQVIGRSTSVAQAKEVLVAEAEKIHHEEETATDRIAENGGALLKNGMTILTHCNTGPLATTGYGTALGIIIRAWQQGKRLHVYATETRPLCQGARLTAWELSKEGVPFTLITDSMAGHFMHRGKISAVIVGADRIARNGDTANKIGTYSLAVLAHENQVPFYVAAPMTTFDPDIASGAEIPIEERAAEEVTHIGGQRIAPEGVAVANPAFDVTPHRYITGIVTEKGIVYPPFRMGLERVKA